MSICVVVADSSNARILLAEDINSPLVEHSDFVHPESRLKQQDLVADGTGSGSDSGGYGKHSMGHENAAHRKEADNFARELCAEVEKLRAGRSVGRLYLVAPPEFLGRLRSDLSNQCKDIVAEEIGKNLVKHSIEDIRAHLPTRL